MNILRFSFSSRFGRSVWALIVKDEDCGGIHDNKDAQAAVLHGCNDAL